MNPLQYSGVEVTSQLSHRGPNGEILKSWLTRPKNTNWPINQLRKHFRAK